MVRFRAPLHAQMLVSGVCRGSMLNVFVVVLDSFGIGESLNAAAYGD